ncbi:MAG: L,D-transpeptidase family protein [Proteobacteria bacterium]|nr:L,D-transpeptidase family protein [Pseudomonadota bacterium]
MKRYLNNLFLDRTGFGPGGRAPHMARLRFGMVSVPCRIGRSGTTFAKREGDGATPAVPLRALAGFWRADRRLPPRTGIPLKPIRPNDGWCDATGDRNYNRLVALPYPASCEEMARKDGQYDVVLDLDWNRKRRAQGRGSAIFLHIMTPEKGPTAGCIALERRRIDYLVSLLSKRTRIIVRG